MTFELISVDLFQTLVDVASIREKVWQIFLGERYSFDRAKKGWDFTAEKILNFFSNEIAEKVEFETVKSVFSRTHAAAFQKFGIDFNHREAAAILARHHNHARPYHDTETFLRFIDGRYTRVVSSDADQDMIDGLPYPKQSDHTFISEALGCYKMDRDNRFFKSVLDRYGIEPHKILHIGDSAADIINPKMLGMKTCWINRTGAIWRHDIRPDHVFTDLKGVLQIL